MPRIIPVFRPVLLGLRNDVRGVEPMWDFTLSLHRAWLVDAPGPAPTATAVPAPTPVVITATPTPAANIFTVTSTADAADADLGDGICDDGASRCTLRAAIMEANALPGRNIINLPAGTYNLTIAGIGEDAARTGDLDIAGHLSITGADRATTIIDGGGKDRVFDILGPSVSPGEVRAEVEIVAVTIQNGNLSDIAGGPYQPQPPCTGNAGVDATGGGVRIGINSTLTLAESNVHGNSAGLGFGGGIYNRGSLTITNSDISGNTAYNGGGIAGAVNITDSTVSENAACSTGGGIWGGSIDISYSTVKDNTAGQRGAGICNCGVGVTLTITNSTVSGNNAGDGIGGGIINFGTLTVTNSTVNGNTASRGGGIFNDGAMVTLTNSTVSENVALSGIGGIYNDRGGSLDVANTSIVDNSGGGILSDGTVVFINAIIANIPPGVDCGGGFTSLGHNLDSDGTCNLTQPTDLSNVDPLLGPLQDNGGTTFTHALLPGSPATDAGDDANCPDPDQRGVARPQGAACDIGAFEFGASVTATPTPASFPLPPQPQGPRGTLNVIDDLGNEQWLLRNAVTERPLWYIGEPLVWWDWEVDGPTNEAILESWVFTENANGSVDWVLNIRPGVKFHKGWGEVTSTDIKFSFTGMLQEGTRNGNRNFFKGFYGADRNNLDDSDPLVLRVRQPEKSNFVELFRVFSAEEPRTLRPYPKAYLDQVGEPEFARNPIYAGPYEFTSQQPGFDLVLTAVPDHYRVTPGFETIHYFNILESATKAAALLTGQIDITALTPGLVQQVQGARINIALSKNAIEPFVNFGGLYTANPAYNPNFPWTTNNPLGGSAVEVRKALNYAIDRQAILDNILFGFGEIGIIAVSLYLDFGMGQSLHLGGSGCGRPVSPWSWKTVRKRGSPHPFRIEPEQLPGPTEPASCKDGPVIRRRC